MILEATVNRASDISYSDGDDVRVLAGKTAELITAPMHADYYTEAYQGRIYHGYTTMAVALPAKNATSLKTILWNPYGSSVNCVLVKYMAGWASGTNAEGNIQLGVLTSAGAAIATGGTISAFTDGSVLNGILGGGHPTHVKFGTAATITTAATQFLPLGISAMQLAANNSSPVLLVHEFKGNIIVPPGVAVFTCASAATVATYHERLIWYEFAQ